MRRWQTITLHLKHHIVPAIGKVRLNQLTRANVAAFRDHLLTKLSRVDGEEGFNLIQGHFVRSGSARLCRRQRGSSVKIGNKGRHKEPVAIPTKAEVKSIMAKLHKLATDKRAAVACAVCYCDS